MTAQFETYHGAGDKAHHGFDGPVHISQGSHVFEAARDDLLDAAARSGWSEKRDLQSMQADAVHGVQRALRYVSPEGIRQDSATCFLHPRLENGDKHPNLHVLVESEVAKVIFEDSRAVGVTYRTATGEEREVRASKLVVLSSGAFGSPAILERSGIGSSGVLRGAGVPIIQELPGVGNNYMDHNMAVYAYRTSFGPDETLDAVASGRLDIEELIRNKSSLLGTNSQDLNIKGRPSESEVKALGPQFEKGWNDAFRDNPQKPLVLMSAVER